MKLTVYNAAGKNAGELHVSDDLVIKNRKGSQALKQSITKYRAGQRAGTASTKTKGEVAGSGKKPWAQKGTGRARAGYKQSPIWRGGGVVFGPKPRDYSQRMNKAVSRLALRRAFSDRANAGDIIVVEQFTIPEAKTKFFVTALRNLKADRGALVILDTVGRDLVRAARNVPDADIVTAANVNTYQLLRYGKVIMSKVAVELLEKRMQSGKE